MKPRTYLESRRLTDRKRLDDTKLRSVKVEYWINIAKIYNDKEFETSIDVSNDIVTMYLRTCMKTEFRVAWNPAKLREQFRHLVSVRPGKSWIMTPLFCWHHIQLDNLWEILSDSRTSRGPLLRIVFYVYFGNFLQGDGRSKRKKLCFPNGHHGLVVNHHSSTS